MHNIASHDSLCRKLATEFNRIVVSVDYRLAPEFKYPACMEDGNAAFKWVYENAESFGGIPEKIILSGDSAGATISASVCLSSINNRLPLPEGLVLFYGMYGAVDDNDSKSMTMFGNGEYVLPKKMSDWCMGLYIPDGTDTSDPYLYPGKADNFAGFPKTVIVLSLIHIWQRSVVSYGACQYIWHIIFFTVIYNAVINVLAFNKVFY